MHRIDRLRQYCKLPSTLVIVSTLWIASGCGSSAPAEPQVDLTELAGLLDESLEKGRRFLVNIQKPEGNFQYEVDFVTGEKKDDDNAIRQAGTLWSVASLHLYKQGDDTRAALIQGLKFFADKSKTTEDGRRFIEYPGTTKGSTGTVALVTLSLIEFLRAEPEHENAERYREQFDQYIKMLLSLRQDDGHLHSHYEHETGEGLGEPLTYYDGESLLALSKAANYLERKELEPLILESAGAMYSKYFVKALEEEDGDSPYEFYQWGSMSFLEIYQSKWQGSGQYAARAIEMAKWLVRDLQEHPADYNNGANHEGLVSAWELAKQSGDGESLEMIGDYVYRDLERLLGFQVGGPRPNQFIRENTVSDDRYIGGTMFTADDPSLRIDVTQHHMHAFLLARKYMLKGE